MLVQLSSDGNVQFWFSALAERTYWNFVKLVHLQNVLLLFRTLLRILIHHWSCDLIKEKASAEKLVWGYKYPCMLLVEWLLPAVFWQVLVFHAFLRSAPLQVLVVRVDTRQKWAVELSTFGPCCHAVHPWLKMVSVTVVITVSHGLCCFAHDILVRTLAYGNLV